MPTPPASFVWYDLMTPTPNLIRFCHSRERACEEIRATLLFVIPAKELVKLFGWTR